MSKLIVNKRLRPLRMAFLVDVSDESMLRRVIRINSSLWGGKFNAIIPVIGNRPIPLNFDGMSSDEIVDKYLRLFEPDFVIDTTLPKRAPGDEPLSLEKDSFRLEDIIGDQGETNLGLSLAHLCIQLYRDDLKYTRRHPFEATISNSGDLFLNVAYGNLDGDELFSGVNQTYQDVFEASISADTSENYASVHFNSNILTVLEAGSIGLKSSHEHGMGHTILLVDETQPSDLMEYWNLRALGRSILALPLKWASELAPQILEILNWHKNKVGCWFPGNYTVGGTASVDAAEYARFAQSLSEVPQGLLSCFSTYQMPWAEGRNNVEAESETADVDANDRQFSFESIVPKFAPDFGGKYFRFANVIEIDHAWQEGESGIVIPQTITDIRALIGSELGHFRHTSEGIVRLCHFGHKQHWKTPTGIEIIKASLLSKGIKTEINEKGSTAYEIVRNLGSLMAVGLIANIELIRLLDSTTRGAVNYEGTVLSFDQLNGLLHKINMPKIQTKLTNDEVQTVKDRASHFAMNRLKNLLAQKVLKLGLKIKCSRCNQNGWHSLDSLSDELLCRRCLQKFDFPSNDPKRQVWSYHTIGPFSTAKYAHGSYSVVLALRYLISHLQAKATWVPSVDLSFENEKHEADFIVYWRDYRSITQMLIGECKSFGDFDQADRERADCFLKQFPDAFFVFSSLGDQLSTNDRRWLSDFAKRAKVIILTAEELTSDRAPDLWHATTDTEGYVIERSRLQNLSTLTCLKHLTIDCSSEEENYLGHA